MRSSWIAPCGFVLALGFIGCQSAPEPPNSAEITNEVKAEATVRAIDRLTRQITLRREDGTQFAFVAGPEVRNFDQIEVGDTVKAHYIEMLSARKLAPDEPSTETAGEVATARAERGEQPAGVISTGVAMTVRVESVDLEQHLVAFTDPAGRLRAVRAQRDEGKAFVAGLKPGDRVELIYGEAVAITVE